MESRRVSKKIITPFENCKPTHAILIVNLHDPQISTLKVFLQAIESKHLKFIVFGNKLDLVSDDKIPEIEEALGYKMLPISLKEDKGLDEVIKHINQFKQGSRIIVLGVFNSGKTSLIARLTGKDLEIGDLPGTTVSFNEHKYQSYTLIDSVGQVIDVSKPLMVSCDLSGCETIQEKLVQCLKSDVEGITVSFNTCLKGLQEAVTLLKKKIKTGGKIITVGAGSSGLVAMEIAGQAWECGIIAHAMTNNLTSCYPISFAKGIAEDEGSMARYILSIANKNDVLIGISASGGTGFVYESLKLAKSNKIATIAITENLDTPLGKNAGIIIKSDAKPEGPASSRIQITHLAIAHALIITLASEMGVTADMAIKNMTPEHIPCKKRGIK